MGLDASHLAASIAKSMEVERTPGATQRASEIAQSQLAGESIEALHAEKATATERLQREKIRQERERRRRDMERRMSHPDSDDSDGADNGSVLDVVA